MTELVKDRRQEQVTPVVIYLGHRARDQTAHIYRVKGAHVSRTSSSPRPPASTRPGLMAESMAANIDPHRRPVVVHDPRRPLNHGAEPCVRPGKTRSLSDASGG